MQLGSYTIVLRAETYPVLPRAHVERLIRTTALRTIYIHAPIVVASAHCAELELEVVF